MFREYKPSDYDDICEIAKYIWEGADYLPQRIGEYYRSVKSHPCVIELDNHVVSVGNLRFITSDIVWLEAMRTHPDYRKRGLARKLTEGMLQKAKELGAEQVWLMTARNNLATGKILETLGFREFEQIHLWDFIESKEDARADGRDGNGKLVDIGKLDLHINPYDKEYRWEKVNLVSELDPDAIVYSEFLAYPTRAVKNWIAKEEVYHLQSGDIMTLRMSRELDNLVVVGVTSHSPLILEYAISYAKKCFPERKICAFYPSRIRHPLFSDEDWIFRHMIKHL